MDEVIDIDADARNRPSWALVLLIAATAIAALPGMLLGERTVPVDGRTATPEISQAVLSVAGDATNIGWSYYGPRPGVPVPDEGRTAAVEFDSGGSTCVAHLSRMDGDDPIDVSHIDCGGRGLVATQSTIWKLVPGVPIAIGGVIYAARRWRHRRDGGDDLNDAYA